MKLQQEFNDLIVLRCNEKGRFEGGTTNISYAFEKSSFLFGKLYFRHKPFCFNEIVQKSVLFYIIIIQNYTHIINLFIYSKLIYFKHLCGNKTLRFCNIVLWIVWLDYFAWHCSTNLTVYLHIIAFNFCGCPISITTLVCIQLIDFLRNFLTSCCMFGAVLFFLFFYF